MSASFYELLKYAATGIASPSMTYFDKLRASTLMGGATVQTLTGIPPLTFKADGTPLTAWSIIGAMTQTGTPTPTVPIQPEECGNLVESGEHAGEYAIPISCGGTTQTIYLTEPLRKIGDYADTISSDGTVTRQIKKLVITGQENITQHASPLSGIIGARVPTTSDVKGGTIPVCTHYEGVEWLAYYNDRRYGMVTANPSDISIVYLTPPDNGHNIMNTFKTWLASEYSAGHPVEVWYVLATPTLETFTAPTIQTSKGANTLEVNTTLPPSEMTITYKG